MSERPILFSAPMVRVILEGRKTQTRRVIKDQPPANCAYLTQAKAEYADNGQPSWAWTDGATTDYAWHPWIGDEPAWQTCPYGVPGDRLWVRETWALADSGGRLCDPCLNYRADGAQMPLLDRLDLGWGLGVRGLGATTDQVLAVKDGWRSPRFMPCWASRITLEITEVRVQRLQEIDAWDAEAEGIAEQGGNSSDGEWRRTEAFKKLWDSINAKTHPWASNPWTWALTFKRVQP